MSFEEYVGRVGTMLQQCAQQNIDMRMGQAFFNVLSIERPELAQLVAGGTIDPFHKDGLLFDFLVFVKARW